VIALQIGVGVEMNKLDHDFLYAYEDTIGLINHQIVGLCANIFLRSDFCYRNETAYLRE
jgi:hypothetical protein